MERDGAYRIVTMCFDHVSYLLQSLRKAGRITNEGSTSAAEWRIAD